MKSIQIPILLGPTATGKTQVAVELAKKLPLQIISADSRQVYKYLSIGTNKPQGKWETLSNNKKVYFVDGIPYHLVDFLEPDKEYNAGMFIYDTEKIITEIFSENCLPMIVGGTGLYIKSFIDGLSTIPGKNQQIRDYLNNLYLLYGKNYLYQLLQNYDPQRASEIHPNNIHRIIRALEIILQTGKPVSELLKTLPKTQPHTNVIQIGLYMSKHLLFNRIVKRTELMFKNGLIEETQKFLTQWGKHKNLAVLSSIGYRWVIKYLQQEIDLETAKKFFIKDTMKYVKNQYTWFKKDLRIKWINCDNLTVSQVVNKVYEMIIS